MKRIVLCLLIIVLQSCSSKENKDYINNSDTLKSIKQSSVNSDVYNQDSLSQKNYKHVLEGRFRLVDVDEAGYIFKLNSDTLYWINEMNSTYPQEYRIQWISDDIFIYTDFKSTSAGVIRSEVGKIIYYDKDKLQVIKYFTGGCNVQPNLSINARIDTLNFVRYTDSDIQNR